MDKRTFSNCLHELSEEKLKDDILEFSRNIVYRSHEELSGNENEDVIDVAIHMMVQGTNVVTCLCMG